MNPLPFIYIIRAPLGTHAPYDEHSESECGKYPPQLDHEFHSKSWFHSIKGSSDYLCICEVRNVGFLQPGKSERFNSGELSHAHHSTASLYEQTVTAKVSGSSASFTSNYMILVTMTIEPDAEEEFVSWHQEEHIPMIVESNEVLSARLCRYRPIESPEQPSESRWISIYEISGMGALQNPRLKAANETKRAQDMHNRTSGVTVEVVEKIATVICRNTDT